MKEAGWDAQRWCELRRTLKFWHGTSWSRAQLILRDGFEVSPDGQLGRGVYVARRDKALRFAQDGTRHGGAAGGLIAVRVSFDDPKFVCAAEDAGDWQLEGHDAVRADLTSLSDSMEWCIKSASQVTVLGIEQVALASSSGGGSSSEPLPLAAPTPHRGLSWRCDACGAERNPMWRPCVGCGADKPLSAVGDAIGLAAKVLSRTRDAASVSQQHEALVGYTTGAMGGWSLGMGDAEAGAPHPPAFAHTAALLPPPEQKTTKVWPDRTVGFNLAIDAVKGQAAAPSAAAAAGSGRSGSYLDLPPGKRSMPPPPPKQPWRGAYSDYRASKRARRTARDDDAASQGSRPTSDYSLQSTAHSRKRAEEREILRRELQSCLKHGEIERLGPDKVRTPGQLARCPAPARPSDADCRRALIMRPSAQFKIYDAREDLTLITNGSKNLAITAFRGRTHGGPRGFLVSEGEPLDLTVDARDPAPPTPQSPLLTPRSPRDSSYSRSRDGSLGRDNSLGRDSSLSRSASQIRRDEPAVGHGAGLGAIREFVRDDCDGDVVPALKARARVVNNFALSAGVRDAGLLWKCDRCGTPDIVAWMPCFTCHARFSKKHAAAATEGARRMLNAPHDVAAAAAANPVKLGVMGGYALGRYKACKEQLERHPPAFDEVEMARAPPRQENCSLPDRGLLRITTEELGLELTDGETPWPDVG